MTRNNGRARPRGPSAKTRRAARINRRRAILAAAAAILLALAGLGWLYAGSGPRARAGPSTDIVLPAGAHLSQIAAALARDRVINADWLFIVAAELTRAAPRLQAGEYEFASGTPMWRVLAAIRDGAVVRRVVTVPEGATSKAVVEILAHADALVGAVTPPTEGAVLPETYRVQRGEERAAVLTRMISARDRLLEDLWRERAPGLPYRTPEQAVILASIVEKETALPAERPRIAGLFINRLRAGIRLESDPTVIYGLTGGVPLGHGLRVSELASPTPYNTYRVMGLPPTPIANPGRAALAAAMRPQATNDLYFVADGTGGHVFSATLAEHLRNVARWRAIEKARAGAMSQ